MKKPQIKLAENEINTVDPWTDDKLRRKECADILTSLLDEQQDALIISLNGEWGSGKSFMLKRWRQDLTNQGHTAIYFNAWEDDFLADPLIAIIGQLWKTLKGSTYEEFCTKVKTSAIPLLKSVGICLLNNGIKELTGIDLSEIADDKLKTAAESAFDNYSTLTDTRENLKERLQALSNKIYEDSGKPLIFIIDELDRCRPTFAIETLERIKHLFDIKHMVFVLGIDREQLGKSIRAIYGDIDVDNYLHRFIDLDFIIPATNPETFFNALWSRYEIPEHLTEKANSGHSNDFDIDEANTFKQICCNLLLWHQFSLREIEQTLKIYILLLRATEAHHFTWPHLAPILILLKLKNQDLYHKYLIQSAKVTEIIDYIMLPANRKDDSWVYQVIPAVIYASYMSDYPQTEQEIAISNMIKAIGEKKELHDLPCIAKCIKELDHAELYNILKIINYLREAYNKSKYTPESVCKLSKKIDLIMAGVATRP